MKKDNNKKVSKINEFNILGIMVQFLLTVACLVIVLIHFVFNKHLLPVIEILMGLDLMIMGYNNHKVYKRYNLTMLYLLVGVIMLIIGILSCIGVI